MTNSREVSSFLASVREHQGLGSLLCIGNMAQIMAARLRQKGADAGALVFDPQAGEGAVVREIEALAAAGKTYAHVAVAGLLEFVPAERVAALLGAIRRIARRSVFLLVDTIRRHDLDYACVEGRDWWETACYNAGFRKHSAYYKVVPYAGIDTEAARLAIPLEVIGDALLEQFPFEALLADRDLHMDMLRESGRRSDGHVFRYHFAAQYVPPNARVVDIACGMGYGSHLLGTQTFAREVLGLDVNEEGLRYAQSMYGDEVVHFARADAGNIAGIATDSVDVVCSFETLEHLPNPHLFLAEAHRILKPGGRLVISVPNDWSDETGKDPNPYHFHVYTWQSLITELRGAFVVDEAFDQTAGGGFKLYHAPRSFAPHDTAAATSEDSEWAIVVAMKPLTGAALPRYEEAIYPYSEPPANLLEFARYYDNAWLVHGIVESAFRLRQSEALLGVCRDVLANARPASADCGAALCVTGYRLLDGATDGTHAEDLIARIDAYVAQASDNPHVIRWQVSLSYLKGEIALAAGRREEAAQAYARVLETGFERFHPMLGSKTIAAARRLAVMSLDAGDVEGAKRHFAKAVDEMRKVLGAPFESLAGRPEQPLACNYFDLVSIVDTGYHSAVALSLLESGLAWRGQFGTFLVDGGYRDALTRERGELYTNAEAYLADLRRVAGERADLYDTAEARLAEIERLGGINRELYDTAESRLAELRALYDTAESRLADLRRLQTERDDLYSIAETRLAEMNRLALELDGMKHRLAELGTLGGQWRWLMTRFKGDKRP
ncbi:class I SAM-dependent methyltransferase [Paraburkholderia lycopersici]|uniref:class I SAM-dependent methyltransferase n=1 Tax=Paraburkholderia lycopersici TaxID=416944 RepID=UPI00159F9B5E|nr:class I SAM-dependent methyltransferase [Paraburkholderia lycopersici]